MRRVRRSRLLWLLGSAAFVAFLILVQQGLTFSAGNRSFIFGQKISYAENQTMHLNGIDFSINKIVPVTFTPPKLDECPASNPSSLIGNWRYELCSSSNAAKQNEISSNKNKQQYRISMSARNISKKVSSLSGYKFLFDNGTAEILDKQVDTSSMVPGSSKDINIHIRVPQSTESVHILIENANTIKYFELNLK